jgi:hypothetical protein
LRGMAVAVSPNDNKNQKMTQNVMTTRNKMMTQNIMTTQNQMVNQNLITTQSHMMNQNLIMTRNRGGIDPARGFRRFLVAAGCMIMATLATYGMPGGDGPVHRNDEVVGRIHVADSDTAENLMVAVYYGQGKLPENPAFVLTPTEEGVFSFDAGQGEMAPFVLEVTGTKGSGRLFVSPDSMGDTIHVTYPVVEEIVFLHTNDHHFDINKLEEFTERVNLIREHYTDVFLFDAGDVFVRHPHRWVENGVLMDDPKWYGARAVRIIESMNALGYDALTLGNHEFDYVNGHTRTALEIADFPLLSANVEVHTAQLPVPESHAIFYTKTGRRVAVLGLSVVSGNKEGIRMNPIRETAADLMFLREGSDVFVALTHIGLENDVALAEDFPQIDVIIGGHSHHMIEEAVRVNGVLVAQAGGNQHVVSDEHPVYLGKVVVRLVNGVPAQKSGLVIFFAE